MTTATTTMRRRLAIGAVSLVAAPLLTGCVEPAYVSPGPIQLQPYPPSVSYRSVPDYRPPVSAPIPLQAAPVVEPLPPPTPAPTVTEVPADDLGGAIPVQDMPPLASDATPNPAPTDSTAADPAAAPNPPPQIITKNRTTGSGANVPLEGFRPMHGQTRVTP